MFKIKRISKGGGKYHNFINKNTIKYTVGFLYGSGWCRKSDPDPTFYRKVGSRLSYFFPFPPLPVFPPRLFATIVFCKIYSTVKNVIHAFQVCVLSRNSGLY